MPATVNLELFNSMSENTQDEFEPASTDQDKETQSENVPSAQADQPLETEAPSENTLPDQDEQSMKRVAPASESELPPEAQGEANGGPLGCCLGVMIGLLLSLSLAVLSRFYAEPLAAALQGNYGLLGLIVRILMGILAFALAIFCGYLGWKVGRRIYREYEPPVVPERKRRTRPKKLQQKT